MRWPARHLVLLAIAMGVAALVTGCTRQPSQRDEKAAAGRILAVFPETGEFRLEVTERYATREWRGEVIDCEMASPSEVYVNDRLVPASELLAGDNVEVLGFIKQERPPELTVKEARVRRPLERPPAGELPPDLPVAATQPDYTWLTEE